MHSHQSTGMVTDEAGYAFGVLLSFHNVYHQLKFLVGTSQLTIQPFRILSFRAAAEYATHERDTAPVMKMYMSLQLTDRCGQNSPRCWQPHARNAMIALLTAKSLQRKGRVEQMTRWT